MNIIGYVIVSIGVCFAASFLAAIVSLFSQKWRKYGRCFLIWALFPLPLPILAKELGVIKHQWKSWLLVMVSPCLFSAYLFVLICIGFAAGAEEGTPDSIAYHTSADLEKATGVKFPEVTPVDSTYLDNFCNNYIRVKFVPQKPLTRKFFRRLDIACKTDSCCWRKDSLGYYYNIYPERPLDRTKVTHRRMVEWKNDDGTTEMLDEWDGDYVSVFVPLKGDTITIEDGWIR